MPSHQASRIENAVFGGDAVEKGERLGLLVALPDEELSPSTSPGIASEITSDMDQEVFGDVPNVPAPFVEPKLAVADTPTFYLYKFKAGDTLGEIAETELGSYKKWEDIAKWNNISNPNSIRAGRDLKIYQTDISKVVVPIIETKVMPTNSSTHTIVDGDTFSSIAERVWGDSNLYYVIEKANPTVDAMRLKIGMKIIIPSR